MKPRKPIPRVNPDTAKAEAEAQRTVIQPWLKAVREYRGEGCMVPGCRNDASEVHEICSGQYRQKCRCESAGLLWLCWECHPKLQGMQFLHEALAIKLVSDPWHFDEDAVREILQPTGRYADVFYLSDVTQHLAFTGVI